MERVYEKLASDSDPVRVTVTNIGPDPQVAGFTFWNSVWVCGKRKLVTEISVDDCRNSQSCVNSEAIRSFLLFMTRVKVPVC